MFPRRNEVLSNRLEDTSDQVLDASPVDQSYFSTREQSIHGDCQTSYNIHPLPTYEAMEIEEQLEIEEQKRNQQEHLPGGLSQGRQACQGRKYWQITKTRNFDNCFERPVFQKFAGLKASCDTAKSSCRDLMSVSIFYLRESADNRTPCVGIFLRFEPFFLISHYDLER